MDDVELNLQLPLEAPGDECEDQRSKRELKRRLESPFEDVPGAPSAMSLPTLALSSLEVVKHGSFADILSLPTLPKTSAKRHSLALGPPLHAVVGEPSMSLKSVPPRVVQAVRPYNVDAIEPGISRKVSAALCRLGWRPMFPLRRTPSLMRSSTPCRRL